MEPGPPSLFAGTRVSRLDGPNDIRSTVLPKEWLFSYGLPQFQTFLIGALPGNAKRFRQFL